MDFAEILARYIGREIEVYSFDVFVEGTLISVDSGSFILRVRSGSYLTPNQEVTVFLINVQGIRVLSETTI